MKTFKPENVVVDHCHKTGLIRDLLCRTCNAQEGHVNTCLIRLCKNEDELPVKLKMLKQQIAMIAKSFKTYGLTKQIFGYVCKTLGRGKTKKEYLDWLQRLGQYWAYHEANPGNLIYGRPETLVTKRGTGKTTKKEAIDET